MSGEKELKYLQMPLPRGKKTYKTVKINWSGLNTRETFDTGALSDCSNTSTDAAPYLIPAQKWVAINDAGDYYDNPISMEGFNDFLLVAYKTEHNVKLDYIKGDKVYTGTLFTWRGETGTKVTEQGISKVLYTVNKANDNGKHLTFDSDDNIFITLPDLGDDIRFSIDNKGVGAITFIAKNDKEIATSNGEVKEYTIVDAKNKIDVEGVELWSIVDTGMTRDSYMYEPRSIVKFNVYPVEKDVMEAEYIEKLLIFPDRRSIDFDIESNFTPKYIDAPRMKYVAVHNSRLFGVDDNRIYASGFNDYANWVIDSAKEHNSDNAWISTAQANVKASGKFKGITAFSGHIICFKSDYMHELYNNKNPYRIQDIYARGTIDNRSIAEVDGKLIFVDEDDVKIYTGGNPKGIGRPLGIDKFDKAVSGSDGRKYYLYCESEGNKYFLVYDSFVGQWSKENIGDGEVLSFVKNSTGMYALTKGGAINKIDSGIYEGVNWWLYTDIALGKTIDIKSIRKIQLLADVDENSEIKIYKVLNNDIGSTTSDLLFKTKNTGSEMKTVPIRIVPDKTAGYGVRLHISGVGYVKLYQLEISYYKGGELFEYGNI